MSTSEIPDSELPKVLTLLSVERMAVLKSITGDERDAVELHTQMLSVAAALMPVMAILEICLRNDVSERMRALFGNADWLQNPPHPFKWRDQEKNKVRKAIGQAQSAAYAKMSQREKNQLDRVAFPTGRPNNLSHGRRSKERQKVIQITIGQLIAQLTLAFWKRLFSSDYETALWGRTLKKTFPDKTINRAMIADKMEIIYQSRNRIAHHELLYGGRLAETLAAIDYVSGHFGARVAEGQTLVEILLLSHRKNLQIEADKLSDWLSKFTVANLAS
jgi:hypothetical protein